LQSKNKNLIRRLFASVRREEWRDNGETLREGLQRQLVTGLF